jgi:hypothetical protein
MTDEKIIKNNRLIAEFMGGKECTVYNGADGSQYQAFGFKDTHVTDKWRVDNKAAWFTFVPYHTSWDWLMPVVEKIEQIKGCNVYTSKTTHGEFSIEISYETPYYSYISNTKSIFIKDKTLSKIEATHKAVVEFIKWYNQQKK